ncbi:MAG TPA: alpha-glucosidase [Chloroflexota bacterium]|nr:alpha-glucosidase [Chloroflexota bacterium]
MAEHASGWWQSKILYQIYPRSFQDSNDDGIGDLPGIIQRLDHLNDGTEQSLGIGGIWLTPAYPSPNFDWGYDVSDYIAIHPDYGTLDDFDRLVVEAEKRGIHIVMDLVANHSSYLHQWFHESRSSRDNPKRDWYIWRDRSESGGYPNNWSSVFGGGSGWEWDEHTEQYYYHAFLQEQPDLNWHNPDVREAIAEVMRFWMRRGVAGFRLDAIAHIGKHPDLPDNPLLPGVDPNAAPQWNTQVHEFDQAYPVMHPWLEEMRRVADEFGALLIGEIYSIKPDTLAQFAGNKELHSVFNFDLMLSPWEAPRFRAAVDAFQVALGGSVWPSPVLNNHDNSRSFTRWDVPGQGARRAAVAALMLLSLPGTPYLYYGEEIGMHDVDIPKDRLLDPVGTWGWPEDKGRDPERTPMQWDSTTHAGFSNAEPWLPVSPDAGEINAEAQTQDSNSLLATYRRLGRLRNEYPALSGGSYAPIDTDQESVWAFIRQAGDQAVVVALNFGDASVTVDLSSAGTASRELYCTNPAASPAEALGAVTLSGVSGRLLLRSGES